MTDFSHLREVSINEELIFHGRIMDVIRRKVQLPNGNSSSREIVRHHGGAAIVPVDQDGMVTLVRQHRIAVDQFTLEIPAGKLNSPDENPLLAAQREMEEEAGLRAQHVELLSIMLPTPGYSTEKLYLYLATGLTSCATHLDADEFVDVFRLPMQEALAQVISGEINDAKTALALLLAKERLSRQAQDA